MKQGTTYIRAYRGNVVGERKRKPNFSEIYSAENIRLVTTRCAPISWYCTWISLPYIHVFAFYLLLRVHLRAVSRPPVPALVFETIFGGFAYKIRMP